MSEEWGSRMDFDGIPDLNGTMSFIYGGLGSLIRAKKDLKSGLMTMLQFLSIVVGNIDPNLLEIIQEVVRKEELPFYDVRITEIDSKFGDE